MYHTDTRGVGPYQGAKLSVEVHYDADGADDQNVNGEWIRVGNASAQAVPIGGWWVRDSGLRRYTFPAGTVVPAHAGVFVHVGSGTATATHKYWRLPTSIFVNATGRTGALGDGGYLFDPSGDLRAWTQYPCILNCRNVLKGKVELRVTYHGDEAIQVVNTSPAPVDLFGHVIVSQPHIYPITGTTILQPGEALTLRPAAGTSTALVRYWGRTGTILNDQGDAVTLRTGDESTVACVAWGSGRC